MRREASKIAVKALVEVLKALELATKMVRKGRIGEYLGWLRCFANVLADLIHLGLFFGAFISKPDSVDAALARIEDVTTEEERMAIAELVLDMHELSCEIQNSTPWFYP